MQNKILKITRMGFALVILAFGALPALAQSCGWAGKDSDYWKAITLEQVQTCLDNETDINAQDETYGATPLHFLAVSSKNSEIIKILIQAGANVDTRTIHGWTPLYLAAWNNKNPEIIKTLIQAGANVDMRTTEGYTPLHQAAESNKNSDIIIALLKAGADGKAKTENGDTPFDLIQKNEALKNTHAYWALNDLRF